MTQVRRFILPGAVAAHDDVFVAGAGLFSKGVLDLPVGDAGAAAAVRAVVPEATDLGTVTVSTTPAPDPGANDPYPQYLTLTDATSSVTTGTDPLGLALKAAFVGQANDAKQGNFPSPQWI